MKRNSINKNDEEFIEITPQYYDSTENDTDNEIPDKKKKRTKKAFVISSICIAVAAWIVCAAFVMSRNKLPKDIKIQSS